MSQLHMALVELLCGEAFDGALDQLAASDSDVKVREMQT